MTHLLPWYTWLLISNVCIIAIEYMNRTAIGGWSSVLPQTAPLIIVAQFCLFAGFNGSPHWLSAWVVFSIGNSIMRIGSVNVLSGHEVTSWVYILAGVGSMLGGALLVKMGLR